MTSFSKFAMVAVLYPDVLGADFVADPISPENLYFLNSKPQHRFWCCGLLVMLVILMDQFVSKRVKSTMIFSILLPN